MTVSEFRNAASLNGPRPDLTELQILQTVTEVARRVFGAAATSIFLVDQNTGELVFTAVSGEGEGHLPGTRFPGNTGIAGWVVTSGQPMLADDLDRSNEFALDLAESTKYVPASILAAPLIRDGECIGVIEVLDRDRESRGELQDVDLIALLATQAALGLEILARLQRTSGRDPGGLPVTDARTLLLNRIADRLPSVKGLVSTTAVRLLETVDELLSLTADPGMESL